MATKLEKQMLIIGIDPGLNGAVGILLDGKFKAAYDIPTVMKSSGRREINPAELRDIIRGNLDARDDCAVALEKVTAMPGNGSSSMFSFGDSYGVCRSTSSFLNLSTELVGPATWKKYFKLGKDKELSRALAIRLFPEASNQLNLKKHSDRAEALLMALWLWETQYK
jgi:crossover junction endodeoxyribonuclease RuvC